MRKLHFTDIAHSITTYICFRRLKKYRVLAGLWFGEEKPNMNTFLDPLVRELQHLYSKGMQIYMTPDL